MTKEEYNKTNKAINECIYLFNFINQTRYKIARISLDTTSRVVNTICIDLLKKYDKDFYEDIYITIHKPYHHSQTKYSDSIDYITRHVWSQLEFITSREETR